jgi:hypothetical protein
MQEEVRLPPNGRDAPGPESTPAGDSEECHAEPTSRVTTALAGGMPPSQVGRVPNNNAPPPAGGAMGLENITRTL